MRGAMRSGIIELDGPAHFLMTWHWGINHENEMHRAATDANALCQDERREPRTQHKGPVLSPVHIYDKTALLPPEGGVFWASERAPASRMSKLISLRLRSNLLARCERNTGATETCTTRLTTERGTKFHAHDSLTEWYTYACFIATPFDRY